MWKQIGPEAPALAVIIILFHLWAGLAGEISYRWPQWTVRPPLTILFE